MKHEIERKFLVIGDGWKSAVTGTLHLRDGLVAVFGGGKVRVRIVTAPGEQPRAFVTLKGPRSGISRREFEYPIPLAEAEVMLTEFCEGLVIEKHRHLVPHDGLVWEVDVYDGCLAGIVHAEIELTDAAQPVAPPPWLGPEVTGKPEHAKRALFAAGLAASPPPRRAMA
jgi:CYTH domain-containing protein